MCDEKFSDLDVVQKQLSYDEKSYEMEEVDVRIDSELNPTGVSKAVGIVVGRNAIDNGVDVSSVARPSGVNIPWVSEQT